MTLYLSNRAYIPVDKLTKKQEKALNKHFSWEQEIKLTANECRSCYAEHEGEPPCDEGKECCPYRYKTHYMYDKYRYGRKYYIGVWRGNLKKVLKHFNYDFKDHRSYARARKQLKFLGSLRVYQVEAAYEWALAKSGIIEAPARSGKTVIGCYLAVKLRMRTLILVHQTELAQQFYETFQTFTDEGKKKNVAVAKNGNIDTLVALGYDIIISTYQTFISPAGRKRLKKVQNKFGFLMIDECQLGSAPLFNFICNTINALYRCGLSATPDRKDEKHILGYHALGPVVVKVKPPQLTGDSIFIYTGTTIGKWSNWATLLNRLAKNKRRNKLIMKFTKKDLKAGHYVLIVTERVHQCEDLHELFNENGIDSVVYHGKVKNRNALLKEIKAAKHKVTIATRKVVQYGLNVHAWSSYHCASPTNNKYNFYQEMSRVRTPWEKKDKILVRVYVDSVNACYSCAKTCQKVVEQEKFTYSKISAGGVKVASKKKQVQKHNNKAITIWNKFADL